METLDCGHGPSAHSPSTTGYGIMDGQRYCYDCCAQYDRERMQATGQQLPRTF